MSFGIMGSDGTRVIRISTGPSWHKFTDDCEPCFRKMKIFLQDFVLA